MNSPIAPPDLRSFRVSYVRDYVGMLGLAALTWLAGEPWIRKRLLGAERNDDQQGQKELSSIAGFVERRRPFGRQTPLSNEGEHFQDALI